MVNPRKKQLSDVETSDEDVIYVEDNSDRFIGHVMLFEILMAVLLLMRSKTAAIHYAIALAPMLIITGIIGNICYQKSADMKLFSSCGYLTSIGIGLQFLIDQVYQPADTFNVIKYLIALLLAVLFIVFYKYFRKILVHRATVYVMMGISAAIYLFLFFAGYDPNGYGTHAWISIAGFTVQLTDFVKVSALLFYASLFSSRYRNDENKVLSLSTIFFLVNLAGSLMIHELGSFIILFILHLAVLFIFLKHSKRKRIYLISIFTICFASVAIAFLLYKLLLPSYQAGTLSGIKAFLWPFARKIYERFSITANLYSDPYGAGYQMLQGKKALWMGGFFGNTVNFSAIPVAESDMAFVALICTLGFPLAFFALIQLTRIAIHGGELARKLLPKEPQDAVVVFGAAAMLFIQGAIVILGSCNVIPFTGLPIPFLSRGFTYQAIVFCFTGILLHLSQEGEEEDDA